MEERLKLLLDYVRDHEMQLRGQRERIVADAQFSVTWMLSAMSFLIGALVTSPDWSTAGARLGPAGILFVAVGLFLRALYNRYGGKTADLNQRTADRLQTLRWLTIETEDEAALRHGFDTIMRDYSATYNRVWRGWADESERAGALKDAEAFIKGQTEGQDSEKHEGKGPGR